MLHAYATGEKHPKLVELITEAVDGCKEFADLEEAEDCRHEAVDGAIPVGYGELLDLLRETDIGGRRLPDTVGDRSTIWDAIQGALYEEISEGVSERWSEVEAHYNGSGSDEQP